MSIRLHFLDLNGKVSWLKSGLALLAIAFGMLVPSGKVVGQCNYILKLYGSNLWGWANILGVPQSYVLVKINGVQYGPNYTMLASSTNPISFDIPVNTGAIITLQYFKGYPQNYSAQYFTLSNCAGDPIYTSGKPPANSSTSPPIIANCDALPTDCLGAVTVCGTTTVLNGYNNHGCTSDLNASPPLSNNGPTSCTSIESKGSWYYFSPSTDGNLGFTIAPTAQHSNDFSLWGPFNSPGCPTGDAIRCSTKADNVYPYNSSTGLRPEETDDFDPNTNAGNGWADTVGVLAGKIYVLYIASTYGSGQAFTLSFTGPTINCTVLPIELIDLQAQARERVVDITWATATEQNSDHYDIQRSFDDSSFVTIGTLPAAGDAQYRSDYAFTDNAPGHGANYYRLKEVDRDGAVTITHTVVALMDGATQVPVLFPNPVTGMLNVSFTAFRDGIAVLTVRDALGRTVREQASPVRRGQQTVRIPMEDLQQGCYSLSVTLPTGIVARGGTFVKN